MADSLLRRGNRKIPIGPKKKIAFVCSGGGPKAAAFHLGAALALQEHGFRFVGGIQDPNKPFESKPLDISVYVGSSAGALIAALLAAGYSLDNIFGSFLGRTPNPDTDPSPKPLTRLTYQKMLKLRPEAAKEQLKKFWVFKDLFTNLAEGNLESLLLFKVLRFAGLFTTAGVEEYLREDVLLSNRFSDYIADLFIVGTQLNYSRKCVFGKYQYSPPPHDPTVQYVTDVPISEACAASTTLPPLYAPYEINMPPDGKPVHFIDGEVRDTMSSHVAVDAGADLVFASYTHQPYHLNKEVGSLSDLGLPSIMIQTLYLLIEQKITNYIHNKKIQRNAILSVNSYLKDEAIPDRVRLKVMEILERELHHRLEVDTVYIHPSPNDPKMFIREHFSLSPKVMTDIVKHGFRAAVDSLRKYDFADAKFARANKVHHTGN